nr:coiled-coil domain-containing protein 87-like isoform X2 [Ciona intestinalis]|eukprot:XP_009861277.2 coiled-coil domain-containing protein 87-like isoform X2 [Ciona intestinalis]
MTAKQLTTKIHNPPVDETMQSIMKSSIHRKHKLQDIYNLERIPDTLNQDCKVKLSNLSSLSLRKSEVDLTTSDPVTPDERPLTPINESIQSPPKSFASLSSHIRKRVHPRPHWDFISTEDQESLAAIILGEANVVWTALRKQVPDPFLMDWQNRELQRRIMVHIVTVCEQLFLYYCGHLKVLNARGVFSEAANVSRIRGQIAVDAGKYMNILAIRRHIVADIKKSFKHKHQLAKVDMDAPAVTTLPSSLSFRALMRKSRPKIEKEHLFNMGIEIKDMKNQMPAIDFRKTYSSLQRLIPVKRFYSDDEMLESDVDDQDEGDEGMEEDGGIKRVRKWDSEPQLATNWTDEQVENASPTPHPQSRIESRATMKTPIQVKSTVRASSAPRTNYKGISDSHLPILPSPREDLMIMMRKQMKEETTDLDDGTNVPALIQAITRREIDDEKMRSLKKEENSFVKAEFDHEVAPPPPKYQQPSIKEVKLPGLSNPVDGSPTIVRTSNEQVSDKVELPTITLTTCGPLYNDLTGEISPSIVKELDSNLFHGEELTEVYGEIMKTVPDDHLMFNNDAVVVTPVKEVDMSKIRMKHTNNNQHQPINPMLKMAQTQPHWEGEGDWKYHQLTDSVASHGTNHKTSREYASWLAWWKSTINTDDYLKYLSTQDSDFLGAIFHFYDSEASESVAGMSSNSARVKAQKEYEMKVEKIQASKEHYERGLWNVNSVILGGLGKLPELDNEDDVTMDEGSIEQRSNIAPSPSSGLTFPSTTMTSHVQQTGTYQRRFEIVWKKLQLTRDERVNIAMKYGGDGFNARLSESVAAWEKVCEFILKREKLLHELELFEREASDPKRLLQKGSSVNRLKEAKQRSKLYKKLQNVDDIIYPLLHNIEKRFTDVVSFKGRPYMDKMEYDKVEMLYWLQQERRCHALSNNGQHEQLACFASDNYFNPQVTIPQLNQRCPDSQN